MIYLIFYKIWKQSLHGFCKSSGPFKLQILIAVLKLRQQKFGLKYWTESRLFALRDGLLNISQDPDNHESRSTQDEEQNTDNEPGHTILTSGQTLQGTGFKVEDLENIAESFSVGESFRRYSGSHPHLPDVSLTSEDVTRYKMAWRAIEYVNSNSARDRRWLSWYVRALVHRCRDWPELDKMLEVPIALGFIAVALIYGGLHALAWFAHFDSPTQQLLWRISACVVMSGFPVLILSAIVMSTENFTIGTLSSIRMCLLLLVYILARVYLVVECFINLSHLPAGVYDVPNWSAYFPHIA